MVSSKIKKTQIFTPTWVAESLLDMVDQEKLSDDNTYFFEPCVGNGQILEPTLERIFRLLEKKHQDRERALAEALFKFYAVEIDSELVHECRKRIYNWAIKKFVQKTDFEKLSKLLVAFCIQERIEHKDFFDLFPKYRTRKK